MNYLAPIASRGNFAAEPAIDSHSIEMLDDAFKAVSKTPGGWETLARPDVPGEQGFMFSSYSDPTVKSVLATIDKNLEYGGHSGSSYGWVMRNMESIAKEGWEALILQFRLSHLKDALRDNTLTRSQRASFEATLKNLNQMFLDAKNRHQNPVANLVNQVKTVDSFIAKQAAQNPTMDPLSFVNAAAKDPGMRAMIPDIDDQAAAMKRFAEGKMSYAEMRSLCG